MQSLKIIYLTPGAGKMYCGNCLRDNAFAAALHRAGHDVCIVPLYLPATLDERGEVLQSPLFFSGINVYLEQKLPLFRYLPQWVRRFFALPSLLNSAGAFAGSTQPAQVGDLTVSMLLGEQGYQAEELNELCRWLEKESVPDIIIFSNAMLLGMRNQIQGTLPKSKTVCLLNGEDTFLDALPEPYRQEAWNILCADVKNIKFLVAPSRYYADYMECRLALPQGIINVLPPGIHLEGFDVPKSEPVKPVLGYFARLCRTKGLDILVDAFIELKKRQRFPELQLKIGGGCTRNDEIFVKGLQKRLQNAGLEKDYELCRNISRQEKIAFLKSCSVFSVPSRLNESFGLYVLESHAAGLPGVFPNRGAFPEIIRQTGGGILFEPENPVSLADAVEKILNDGQLRSELSRNAERSVRERYNIDTAVQAFTELTESKD